MDSTLTSYDRSAPLRMSADILLGSLQAAETLGFDLTNSLKRSGLDKKLLLPGDAFVPIHCVVDFFNDVAAQSGCDYFGFLVGLEQPPHRFSHIGRVIKFASTVGQVISDAITLSLLNSEFTRWEIVTEAEHSILIRRTRVALNAPMTQLQTLALTTVFKSLNALTDGHFKLQQVNFSHGPTEYKKKMEAFFDAPIPSADPELYAFLINQLKAVESTHLPTNNLVETVTRHIQSTLGTTRCNFDYISHLVGMHPRKLQRELQAKGIHFKGLLNEIRQNTAEDFLINSSASILEISDMLGYQNASAFSRAFKKVKGLPPQEWQKQVNRA